MKLRTRIGVAVLTAAALTLSACGSNSLGGSSEPGGSAVPSVSSDTALADKLPPSIKAAGKINVGSDTTYAPSEYTQGSKIVGFDVDLFKAVAAKFGVTADFHTAKFDSIIVGVSGKKYDVGVSSFTINADRMKQVTMVSYYSAGTQWATPAGNPKKVSLDNPCGQTIAVQTATVQQLDDLPARQKKCGSNKINILPFDKQDQATAAVASGRAAAMLADSPVVAYAVKQAGGKLAPLGDVYAAAPYGYALPKSETAFGEAIAEALKQLKADGTYQQILTKWGVQQGAISEFSVNPTS